VFGAPTLEALYVSGRAIVEHGRLTSADPETLGRAAARAARTLRDGL
jgi:hypothetical protein